MKGGEALVETLIAHGVDTAFTVPGESFLYALDGMRKRPDQIRVVSVRQEGGGAFMAEAFGKLTGRPAAVVRQPGARVVERRHRHPHGDAGLDTDGGLRRPRQRQVDGPRVVSGDRPARVFRLRSPRRSSRRRIPTTFPA